VRDITDGAPDLADVPEPLVPLIKACLAKKPRPVPAWTTSLSAAPP